MGRIGTKPSSPKLSRRHPFVAILGLSLLIHGPYTSAQNEAEIEEVVVTGTRIDRDEDHSPPFAVQHVSEVEIRDSGE